MIENEAVTLQSLWKTAFPYTQCQGQRQANAKLGGARHPYFPHPGKITQVWLNEVVPGH
jgi:hypothetical protein